MSTDLRDTMIAWIDRRIAAVLRAPPAWGSPEAVEMQVLLLLEARAVALRPAQEEANPRRILETYFAYLRREFPKQPQQPLFELVGSDDEVCSKLAAGLRGFIEALSPSMLAENPFQHSDIGIKLRFEPGRMPTASAFTGYYEEFRRAARAVTRPPDKATGVSREVEIATDFVMEDARVRAPNGAPAEVFLLLGSVAAPRQRGLLDETDPVRDALSALLTMGEWAASSANLKELPFDDAEQRTRLAVQARRILPSRGIATASIGGRLVGRSKPVEFRSEYEPRFRQVIEASTAYFPFDERDEVRAVDLDRGLVILGKKRMSCYVPSEVLAGVAAGVQAHVVGRLYRPLASRPFVLVDHLDVSEPSVEAD